MEREIVLSSERYIGRSVFPQELEGQQIGAYLLVTLDAASQDDLDTMLEQMAELVLDAGAMEMCIRDRAKDVEEMNGHFLMFNYMLDTLDDELSQDLIKRFHYELKSGVFEDRANGYAIGDYKERPNMVGMYTTVRPKEVPTEMERLLAWYHSQEKTIQVLAEFHARYESIHPFQDGNGRTGRMILFRESLKSKAINPFIILDDNRNLYIDGLKQYREEQKTDILVSLMEKEAEIYYHQCEYFME